VRPRFDDDDWEPESEPAHGRDGWFDGFFADGLITDVLMPLKSGKEASVYLCRANPGLAGASLVAAKVFHARDHRSFKNRSVYEQGQAFGKHREDRAVRTKTAFGRQVE
jgi:RIO kinase 1